MESQTLLVIIGVSTLFLNILIHAVGITWAISSIEKRMATHAAVEYAKIWNRFAESDLFVRDNFIRSDAHYHSVDSLKSDMKALDSSMENGFTRLDAKIDNVLHDAVKAAAAAAVKAS